MTILPRIILVILATSGWSWCQTGPSSGSAEFNGCRARWNSQELTLGNTRFERKWRIKDGQLTATSFRNLESGTEWIRKPARKAAPLTQPWSEKVRGLTISASTGRLDPTGEESLQVMLEDKQSKALVCRFRIFPEAAGVEMRVGAAFEPEISLTAKPGKPAEANVNGLERGPAGVSGDPDDSLEDLMLSPQLLHLIQVRLMDQTDAHTELVQETEWMLMHERSLELSGNVFIIEDPTTREGLVFLKLAPLPHARPVKNAYDCQVNAGQRSVRFAGHGYPSVLLTYRGGIAGRTAALQDFQRQLRRYEPDRDGMFLSNTWGDRSADGRVSEQFILKEIDAGARLGVDVVQIDDGWQKGMTGNSTLGKGAWGKFYAADPDFWTPNLTRFPNGLEPIAGAAKARNMKFGLWFAPDSSDENSHWERDADLVLGNYRKYGVDYVKIDAVEIRSRAAEANLHKFYDKVLRETEGRLTFDSDATAGLRPSYFGAPATGPVFVENRYTDWQSYWPHLTLRNLWKLAHYVDPVRLRMEFLNNTRNAGKYGDNPLAPHRYSPDTLFATVMFSSPLGWFEVSNLPEDYQRSVADLVRIWKQERARLFAGHIVPIGEAPDGQAWTGFSSVAKDARSGYLLLFREMNASAVWSMDLDMFAGENQRVTRLAGKGEATVSGDRLTVRIPDTLQYLWLRVE